MGFCEGLGRCGIMAQMDVHAVAPVTIRRDLRHGAIDGAGLGRLRRDPDDGVFRNDSARITPADIDLMTAPLGSDDHPLVAVIRPIAPDAPDSQSIYRARLDRFSVGSVRRPLPRATPR